MLVFFSASLSQDACIFREVEGLSTSEIFWGHWFTFKGCIIFYFMFSGCSKDSCT